jgi:hypothetical protein
MNKSVFVLDFNRALYQKEIEQLEAKVKALNESEAILSKLSEALGKELKSVQEVELYLQERTGWVNIQMAADALGVKEDYLSLLRLEEASKVDKSQVSKKDGVYSLKPSVKDDLKEKNTSYLPEHKRPYYLKLMEAVDFLNSLPTVSRSSIRIGLDAKWHINIHRFNEERDF